MNKELLDKLEEFEIFAEKIEQLCNDAKADEKYKDCEAYDIRFCECGGDSDIFAMPTDLFDYIELWEFVVKRYENYLENKDNDSFADEMYFDIYANYGKNGAVFTDHAIWFEFSESGIIIKTQTKED